MQIWQQSAGTGVALGNDSASRFHSEMANVGEMSQAQRRFGLRPFREALFCSLKVADLPRRVRQPTRRPIQQADSGPGVVGRPISTAASRMGLFVALP
jgi:hypothetical protein